MGDRIPGSSYSNPIWHGKWRIFVSDHMFDQSYEYVHDDYDGAEDAEDDRCGYAKSIEQAKELIDEYEAEHA